jgi:hypothetical protein
MTHNELRNALEDLAHLVIQFGEETQLREFAPIYTCASQALTQLALSDAMIEQEAEGTLQ